MRIRKYCNMDPVKQQNSFKQFKRWRQERKRKLKHKDYSYVVPNVQPDLPYLKNNGKMPSVTWVGHSTFFIQLCGLNIITDPVWAGQMAMQKRLSPPGIPIEDVPPIDVVLISHSHYDHLNITSLRKLRGKQILVPAGLSSKLKLKGFDQVQELNWWDSIVVGGVEFIFVPSQHWTRRNPWDTNSSHWGGWIMKPLESALSQAGGKSEESTENALAYVSAVAKHSKAARPIVNEAPTVYFAGDSGYFAGFKEIGERYIIDIALMPIGAYEPEWFMGPQHVTPEEALQAFLDTGAKLFVPMHYGSFKLADDTPREALDRLEAERRRLRMDEQKIIVLPHGETWRVAGK